MLLPSSCMFTTSVGRGLLPGAAGAAALVAFEPLERKLLGHEPIYSARRIATRLFGRRGARLAGPLQLSYAVGLATLAGAISPPGGPKRSPTRAAHPFTRWLVRSVCFAAAIAGFELSVVPRLRATPPLSSWPRRDRRALLLHTLVFAAVAEGFRAGTSRRPPLTL
jgi:hypothetical protein